MNNAKYLSAVAMYNIVHIELLRTQQWRAEQVQAIVIEAAEPAPDWTTVLHLLFELCFLDEMIEEQRAAVDLADDVLCDCMNPFGSWSVDDERRHPALNWLGELS